MAKKSQSGVTLIEILVTLVILAIGLLGLLNLQIVSLKNNHSAQQRTTAVLHVYDILDRIRLNKAEDYSIAMRAAASGQGLKNEDLAEWKSNLNRDLPSGDGQIVVAGDLVTITVRWDDSRGTQGANQQEFEVRTQR